MAGWLSGRVLGLPALEVMCSKLAQVEKKAVFGLILDSLAH